MCIIFGVLLSIVLIGIPLLVYGILAVTKYAKEAELKAEDLEKRAKSHLKRQCASCDDPVVYHGWNGSIHTFEFYNHQYAQAFIAANRGKVLS